MALVVNTCLCCFCYFSLSVISTSHQHETLLEVVRGTVAVEVVFDGDIWWFQLRHAARVTARKSKVVILNGLPWWVSERR